MVAISKSSQLPAAAAAAATSNDVFVEMSKSCCL